MWTADTAPATLADLPRKWAAVKPDAIAHVFEGRETTFAAFDALSNRVANGLIALGLKPQSRIAYLGKNSDLYFELLYGAAKARVVLAPVNWRLAPAEIAYIVEDCQAEALFVGPEFSDSVAGFAQELKRVKTIVAMEGAAHGWPDFSEWRDAQSPSDPGLAVARDDVAIQLYTSGTTGHPKGAMLQHRNLLGLREAAGDNLPDWNRWSEDDVSLIAMPIFHIGGSGWQMATLVAGARGVITREFNP